MSLTKKQKEFLNLIKQGSNVFLTGKAGTGKTYVAKLAIENLKSLNKKVAIIAPTGVAANNIGGVTIHSMFSIRPYGVVEFESCNFLKSEKRKLLESVDCLVIDEVSMLRPDILDAINWTLIKNGCSGLYTKQIIFIGDLKQLSPPTDDNTLSVLLRHYPEQKFYCAKVFNQLNVKTIELDEVKRQSDTEFLTHLNIVRDGGKSEYFRQFLSKNYHGIVLAPHNSTVKKYNEQGLSQINSQEVVFEAVVEGNANADEFNLERTIKVKNGAKIMYLVNSKDNPLHNGTLGEFVNKDGVYFIKVGSVEYALEEVKLTKVEYRLNSDETDLELIEIGSITQMPIKLAYALSIHKSQGLTFDEVTIDLSLPCFSDGQLYTALSRVRTPEGLKIIVNR